MFIKNTAVTGLIFGLVNNSTGSPLTGAAASCWVSIDGGAAASPINMSPSELSNGLYKQNLAACHMNGSIIGIGFTAASAVPVYFTIATIPASALSASNIADDYSDALLDRANGVESGWSLRKMMRLMSSALLGKASGGGTATVTFRDVGDTTNRIVATVDANGNRSAVTLSAS